MILWKKEQISHVGTNHVHNHYNDVIMSVIGSQLTGVSIVYPTVCSGADQTKHKKVKSPHKGPVTWNMLPFDDVIMIIMVYSSLGETSKRSQTNKQISDMKQRIFEMIMNLLFIELSKKKKMVLWVKLIKVIIGSGIDLVPDSHQVNTQYWPEPMMTPCHKPPLPWCVKCSQIWSP